MDLETNRRIRIMRKKRNENYILEKLKSIRNNENKKNITSDEEKLIIDLIKKDFDTEKEIIINKILEFEYKHKKIKIFINKDKFLNSKKEKYCCIIDTIKKALKSYYKINNNYTLYYCKSLTNIYTDAYKNKSIYPTLRNLIIRLAILEESYSNKLKCLYSLSNNWNELKNIRKYESINRTYEFKQQEMLTNTINVMSKNIKTLRYNVNKTIDNGFFGL